MKHFIYVIFTSLCIYLIIYLYLIISIEGKGELIVKYLSIVNRQRGQLIIMMKKHDYIVFISSYTIK